MKSPSGAISFKYSKDGVFLQLILKGLLPISAPNISEQSGLCTKSVIGNSLLGRISFFRGILMAI